MFEFIFAAAMVAILLFICVAIASHYDPLITEKDIDLLFEEIRRNRKK